MRSRRADLTTLLTLRLCSLAQDSFGGLGVGIDAHHHMTICGDIMSKIMFNAVNPHAPQRDRSIMDVPSIDDNDDDDDVGSIIDVPSIDDDDDDDDGSGKIAPPPQLPSSSHARGMMRWRASSRGEVP